MSEKSIVGDLINFRGLVYSPINENGVVFLFGKVAHDLNMYVEEVKPGFPDCIARRFVGKGWERVRIEFEYQSSNFITHKHNPDGCDIIVCWEHDWKDCQIEVIELRSEIKTFPNHAIARPASIAARAVSTDAKVAAILKRVNASRSVGQWFTKLLQALREEDDSIWANPGEVFVGLYSPEKSFASIRLQATSIHIECFSGGRMLNGTKVSNEKSAPRWSKFSVKSERDVVQAIGILKKSRRRLREAIRKGESTAYFSGGVYSSGNGDTEAEDGEGVAP